ncbi:MAG: hypothetical protein ACFFD4_11405, partial [Candidatus Odinarchaeota archaeon]
GKKTNIGVINSKEDLDTKSFRKSLKEILQRERDESILYDRFEKAIYKDKWGKRDNVSVLNFQFYDISTIDEGFIRFANIRDKSSVIGVKARHIKTDFGKDNKLVQLFQKIPFYKSDGSLDSKLNYLYQFHASISKQDISLSNIIIGEKNGKPFKLDVVDYYQFLSSFKKFIEKRYYDKIHFFKVFENEYINRSIGNLEDVYEAIDNIFDEVSFVHDIVSYETDKNPIQSFINSMINNEKRVSIPLKNFAKRLTGISKDNPVWLEVEKRYFTNMTGNTVEDLIRDLENQLKSSSNDYLFRWNLTTLVKNDDSLQKRLLAALLYGEKSPDKFGKGLGVEIGYNKFLYLIARSLEAKMNSSDKSSTNSSNVSNEVSAFIKGLSLDGSNPRFALPGETFEDFYSSTGRTEAKIVQKLDVDSRIFNKHHTLAQIINIAHKVALGKHGSLLGINIVKNTDAFKIKLVILEFSRVNDDIGTIEKNLVDIISNNADFKASFDGLDLSSIPEKEFKDIIEHMEPEDLVPFFKKFLNFAIDPIPKKLAVCGSSINRRNV